MHFLNQALGMGFRELQVAGPMMVTMTFFAWVHDLVPWTLFFMSTQ